MAPKPITIGSTEFKVDLKQLHEAIGVVGQEAASLRTDEASLLSILTRVESVWKGPAGNTFPPVQKTVTDAFTNLLNLLDDMHLRMRKAYDNYVRAEEQNAKNLQHNHNANVHTTKPGGHSGNPDQGNHQPGHQPGHQPDQQGHHHHHRHHHEDAQREATVPAKTEREAVVPVIQGQG